MLSLRFPRRFSIAILSARIPPSSSPISLCLSMSAALFQKVDRLFSLLDLDSNGVVDRSEARLGFLACFDTVHRDSVDLSPAEKSAVVEKQVSWLFAATSHDESDASAGVRLDEFRSCYSNLLKGAYEEEVLALDLQRAITGLEQAGQWVAARGVLDSTNQIYRALALHSGVQHGAALSLSDARTSSALHRMFEHITGRSQVLGPKRQTQARKIVAPLFGEAPPAPPAFGAAHSASAAGSAAAAPSAASAAAPSSASAAAVSVSLPQLLRVVKGLLALPVPVESLAEDVEAARLIATGAASADGAASSASATAAAPANMES